ncbi:hypothetical protein KFK09_011306 [Dendrobium nobile]|uniref:DUF4219 domain-containing protein n=1 Tax=Dendrobium nobile TaxID=94219 RepID=A0A8T3BEJ0_DENNO|nr:hypothetical protein KFK09_011306 [Dendrobium nobile]
MAASSSSNNLQPQLPKFTGKNYNQWSIQMRVFYQSQELWEIVESGFQEPKVERDLNQRLLQELKENRKKDRKVLFFIYQAVDEIIFERISTAKTAKEA